MEVSHHKLHEGEFKNTSPLVFVMDDLPDPESEKVKKEKKSKKSKTKDSITTRNFGAHVDVSKLKSAEHLSLAWRCRFFGVFKTPRPSTLFI